MIQRQIYLEHAGVTEASETPDVELPTLPVSREDVAKVFAEASALSLKLEQDARKLRAILSRATALMDKNVDVCEKATPRTGEGEVTDEFADESSYWGALSDEMDDLDKRLEKAQFLFENVHTEMSGKKWYKSGFYVRNF